VARSSWNLLDVCWITTETFCWNRQGDLFSFTKVGYPREGTRQTVCERLNDVWVRGRWPLTDYIGIHRHFTYNGSYGFCQNQFVPR
jgi:hypothetical protein